MMALANLEQMKTFGIRNLPNLDVAVLGALEFFSLDEQRNKLEENGKKLEELVSNKKRYLVVGSGNAAETGRILFGDIDASYEDESTYQNRLNAMKAVDGAILVSAFGGKHSHVIAKYLKEKGLDILLLTCNPGAKAKENVDKDKIILFPALREPYSFNVSTYMSMILAKTKEDPQKILDFINKEVKPIIPENLNKYKTFYFIIPPEFSHIERMYEQKFGELFGGRIMCKALTPEEAKHGATIVRYNAFFVGFLGSELKDVEGDWGFSMDVPISKDKGYAAMMAIGYYLIGKIQSQNDPWFKENLKKYCERVSRIFKEDILPITEYKSLT